MELLKLDTNIKWDKKYNKGKFRISENFRLAYVDATTLFQKIESEKSAWSNVFGIKNARLQDIKGFKEFINDIEKKEICNLVIDNFSRYLYQPSKMKDIKRIFKTMVSRFEKTAIIVFDIEIRAKLTIIINLVHLRDISQFFSSFNQDVLEWFIKDNPALKTHLTYMKFKQLF
ncbi:MAG: hypothetical protein GY870_10740 [archaeon]|nr:hypothetical protein [archaeon]